MPKSATPGGSWGPDIEAYHQAKDPGARALCELLAREIAAALPDAASKVWHGHPVWFLRDNPIVGYSVAKAEVRLLFWSGQSFDEPALRAVGSFQAAQARYESVEDVELAALRGWLAKGRVIQWDYKNIARRKGRLERLTEAPSK